MEMIQNRNNFGWEWGRIETNKEDGVLFNQITSLDYTMQRALHSVRMVPLPRWSVTFSGLKIPHATNTTRVLKEASLGMTPVPRQHTCQSWCTGTQPAEASRNKENPAGSRGADRQCSLPRNSTTLASTCNHPAALRQAEKGIYTAHKRDHTCKLQSALPEHLTTSRHFKFV